jgi:hypothetical protein
MIRVYKAPIRHTFGWTDPRAVFGGVPTRKDPVHKRLVEDTETGKLNEYIHEYIHGAVNANIT